jgi:hypothetical protein
MIFLCNKFLGSVLIKCKGCMGLGINPSPCLELYVDWHGSCNYMMICPEMNYTLDSKIFVGKFDETTFGHKNSHLHKWCWSSLRSLQYSKFSHIDVDMKAYLD